jgi:hypothetical protein
MAERFISTLTAVILLGFATQTHGLPLEAESDSSFQTMTMGLAPPGRASSFESAFLQNTMLQSVT